MYRKNTVKPRNYARMKFLAQDRKARLAGAQMQKMREITDPVERLKHALHLRIAASPDVYAEESLWETETDAICQDTGAAVRFIAEEITDEELYYLGEIFDDVMERTHSAEFLNCLRKRVQSVENAARKAEISENIRTAAEYIEE